jgi:hypothetical protein
MDEDKEQYLFDTYPTLYWQRTLPMSQTCMCWGISVGNGWFSLIDLLSKAILPYVDKLNKQNEEWFNEQDEETKSMLGGPEVFGVVQVKEKFGGLRYYTSQHTEEIGKLIDLFERLSYQTCEVCGNLGQARGGGWIKTLCDEHANGSPVAEDFAI